jgi:hypothetical protein
LSNEKLVRLTLEKYFVEDCPPDAVDYDNQFEWSKTPFYETLKRRVRAHFANTKSDHRATWQQWGQLLFFIAASGVALYYFLQGYVLAMLVLPFFYWWGPSPCMHDGGHFSLSRYPLVNKFLAHLGGAHMSLFSWQHQHTIGHHVHTNIAGSDPDLYHFTLGADAGMPGFRTSVETCTLPEKAYDGCSRSAWWRRGFQLRVPLATFGPSILWDPMSLADPIFDHSFMGIVPYPQLSSLQLFTHSVGRCIVIWLALIHPITICLVAATDWGRGAVLALLFAIIPFGVHGTLFYMFSQVSHVQHQCFTPTATAVATAATAAPDEKNAVQGRDESGVDEVADAKAKACAAANAKASTLDGLLARWHHPHPFDEITLRNERNNNWQEASLGIVLYSLYCTVLTILYYIILYSLYILYILY